jgi:nitrite reductase/ring-hydroxylating ferredoxin subunit/uncharacterized membrane protein
MSSAAPDRPRRPSLFQSLVDAVESAAVLDTPAKAIGGQVRSLLSAAPLKQALSGTWLGHPVHPMLTDIVIGSFTGATVLDLIGGEAAAAASERLIGVGIAAYGPTALTGVNDWTDSESADDRVRRVGLVHAVTNATALSLYVASLAARRRGARGPGVLLGLGGATVLATGAFLGGHLSFARGVGVDQTAFDPGPEDWTPAADASLLPDGRPTRVVVEDTPVLLLRDGDRFFAIHDRCSHRGCSLSDGKLEGDEIVCPCHGSRFDRRDGSVRQGPATAPQPAFQARLQDGRVEVRRLRATG